MTRAGGHLILVGLMGAGKSEVGRRCARTMGRDLVDTDALVEAAAGAPITEIFASEGEAGFRRQEAQAVADACAAPVPAVIAAGGGAVVDAANRRALREGGFVVWLTATPETLARRVGADGTRPLLVDGDPAALLSRLAELREAAYAEVADAVVDTEGRSPDEVAADVVAAFDRSDEEARA